MRERAQLQANFLHSVHESGVLEETIDHDRVLSDLLLARKLRAAEVAEGAVVVRANEPVDEHGRELLQSVDELRLIELQSRVLLTAHEADAVLPEQRPHAENYCV